MAQFPQWSFEFRVLGTWILEFMAGWPDACDEAENGFCEVFIGGRACGWCITCGAE